MTGDMTHGGVRGLPEGDCAIRLCLILTLCAIAVRVRVLDRPEGTAIALFGADAGLAAVSGYKGTRAVLAGTTVSSWPFWDASKAPASWRFSSRGAAVAIVAGVAGEDGVTEGVTDA